jgi:hypothetical protein
MIPGSEAGRPGNMARCGLGLSTDVSGDDGDDCWKRRLHIGRLFDFELEREATKLSLLYCDMTAESRNS